MHLHKIFFTGNYIDESIIYDLLSAWRNNGQVFNDHYVIYTTSNVSKFIVVETPEKGSLDGKWNNRYIAKWLERLFEGNVSVRIVYEGSTQSSDWDKNIATCKSLILYCDQTSFESPLRDGNDFSPIPLYYLPKTTDDFNYKNIIEWLDYSRAITVLSTSYLESVKALKKEMKRVDSRFNQRGLIVAHHIERVTKIPTYYYLYNYTYKTSVKQELTRRLGTTESSVTKLDLQNEHFQLINKRERLVSNITPQLLESVRTQSSK